MTSLRPHPPRSAGMRPHAPSRGGMNLLCSWRGLGPVSAVLTCVAGLVAFPVVGQEPEDAWTVSGEEIALARAAPLFQSDEILEFTLSADFHTIKDEDRGDDEPERRPGILNFEGPDGRLSLDVNVEARGNWRRNSRNCRFPPLWIDLDKDDEDLEGTVFEGQNRLKLYVTCRPGDDTYEEYIYTEYVIYPAYNALTDLSFRARPARVTYIDVSAEDDRFTSNAFLLEHKEQMAARNSAVPLDAVQLHPALVAQEEAALMELFNYAVGMTDYNQTRPLHNVEPIRRMDAAVIPVAYDFDWSGTVNARYARPDPSLPISNVRQRTFQGYCRDIDYAALFGLFAERRDAMREAVDDFDELDGDRKDDILEYWEGFFEIAADPSRHDDVLEDCKRIPS